MRRLFTLATVGELQEAFGWFGKLWILKKDDVKTANEMVMVQYHSVSPKEIDDLKQHNYPRELNIIKICHVIKIKLLTGTTSALQVW